jgi:hypothetical protein
VVQLATGRQGMNRRWQAHAIPVALVGACALLSALLSLNLREDSLPFMFAAELDTLRGAPILPEFGQRILFPLLLQSVRSAAPAAVSDAAIWRGLRFAEAGVAYLVIYGVGFALTRSRIQSLIAVALVTYAYLWTPMTLAWELTSDFFDLMFIALAIGLAVKDQAALLALAVIIGSTNRESMAFAGVLWFCVAWNRSGRWQQWRTWLPALSYIALAGAITVGLRTMLTGTVNQQQQIGLLSTLENWRWLLHPTGSAPMFLSTALVFVLALRLVPRPWSAEQRGLLLSAIVCGGITAIFGIATELRVWLPCWVMLSFVVALGEPRAMAQNIRD